MSVADFQPLFPEERVLGPLRERAAKLIGEAGRLAGLDDAQPALLAAVRPLLRAMNSYYTNKIEGQHTLPADIERALKQQYDADAVLARKQRLAVAHLEVEAVLERDTAGQPSAALFAPRWVVRIHAELYRRLPEPDRPGDDGWPIAPGELRTRDVTAGRHQPPPLAEVPALLEAWARRYSGLSAGENLLIGAACAHQRLLWIHPFADGNGRAARLHLHAVLHAMGLTRGLWSPMRGFARTHEQYYARLNNADLPRRNDMDGRGALSQEELVAFAAYALEVCIDQVRFMRERLKLEDFRGRLRTLLLQLQAQPWRLGAEMSTIKPEALEVLHYVALAGPLERARFLAMSGLSERTARRVLASLLDYGLLVADSSRSPVRFALPQKALRFLFPSLWPEAEVG